MGRTSAGCAGRPPDGLPPPIRAVSPRSGVQVGPTDAEAQPVRGVGLVWGTYDGGVTRVAKNARVRGSKWPLFAVLMLLCAGGVFGAWTMQRRALQTSIDEKVSRVGGIAVNTVSPSLVGVDLTKPLPGATADALTARLNKAVISGASVRARIFAKDGTLLFSTDESDRIGSQRTGAASAILSAAGGMANSVVDSDSVSLRAGAPVSLQLLQVYAPLTDKGKPQGVFELDMKYKGIDTASQQPWRSIELAAAIAAIVFLELTLVGLVRMMTTKRLAARSGFQSQAAARPAAPTESRAAGRAQERETKAVEKEAQIRQALEDQLSTLRTQLKKREEDGVAAAREFAEQLRATTQRAEKAEAMAKDTSAAERAKVLEERATQLDEQLRQTQQLLQESHARVAEVEAERAAEASARGSARESAREPTEPASEPSELPAETEAPAVAPPTAVSVTPEELVSAALDRAVTVVRNAPPEECVEALAAAASALYGFVTSGELRGSDVAEALVAAAVTAGLAEDEARRQIASAFLAKRSA